MHARNEVLVTLGRGVADILVPLKRQAQSGPSSYLNALAFLNVPAMIDHGHPDFQNFKKYMFIV